MLAILSRKIRNIVSSPLRFGLMRIAQCSNCGFARETFRKSIKERRDFIFRLCTNRVRQGTEFLRLFQHSGGNRLMKLYNQYLRLCIGNDGAFHFRHRAAVKQSQQPFRYPACTACITGASTRPRNTSNACAPESDCRRNRAWRESG